VALVTGASSGIGEATARLLDEQGWRVLLVARRAERLERLAGELQDAHPLALDLTADDAPARVRERTEQEGALHLLVNNAGAAWRGRFADTGFDHVRRHLELNFDAVARVTEALLPQLRASAPSAIVNVASVAGRISRPNSGGYSVSKFALVAWNDALHLEEKPNGVHVGMVLPGFVATEGFPQRELRESARTRRLVSTPEHVARAILDAGPGGKPERYVPRWWRGIAALRTVAPGLTRRISAGGGTTPATGADQRD
jgi:short-subunit dehydrogenase